MARYLGPREKIERRLGTKLFLKVRVRFLKIGDGEAYVSADIHGKAFVRRSSEYGQAQV